MVGKTILNQLGGNKFIVMTGASKFMQGNNSLTFSLPSKFAKDGINKVVITLEVSDTYKVQFCKIWGTKFTLIAEINDIYNDQLQEIFTKYTGLDTHL